MTRKVRKASKRDVTAIRLNIPSGLWRKFRAGCLYMDKDVNDELNRLIDSWVQAWHKRILKPEAVEGAQGIEHPRTEENAFGFQSGPSSSTNEGSSTT